VATADVVDVETHAVDVVAMVVMV
jgi:hypothetical protein